MAEYTKNVAIVKIKDAKLIPLLVAGLMLFGYCRPAETRSFDFGYKYDKYCENRGGETCCGGRRDDCTVPYRGGVCYCDEFCTHRPNSDCCPDFLAHCDGSGGGDLINGVIPNASKKESQVSSREDFSNECRDENLKVGESKWENCNECACEGHKGTAAELRCTEKLCLVDEKLLNQYHAGWISRNYTMFWNRSYDEGFAQRLGVIGKEQAMYPVKLNERGVPRAFDSSNKWPGLINPPRDQGWCAASWIISAVDVASDRFSVATGRINQLSPQHLLSCVSERDGCQGGHLTKAWTYIRNYGLMTEYCYPWEGRHSTCKLPRSRSKYENVMETTCVSKRNGRDVKTELYTVSPAFRIGNELQIMAEIFSSGPVQATMKVTRDFFSYSRGVYQCPNLRDETNVGHHAVRITGWGEEFQNGQSVKYWNVANSWGTNWGEEGYFRIKRGTNECGIEDFVISVIPMVKDTIETGYFNEIIH